VRTCTEYKRSGAELMGCGHKMDEPVLTLRSKDQAVSTLPQACTAIAYIMDRIVACFFLQTDMQSSTWQAEHTPVLLMSSTPSMYSIEPSSLARVNVNIADELPGMLT